MDAGHDLDGAVAHVGPVDDLAVDVLCFHFILDPDPGCQFNRLKKRLKNHLRFKFDSMTCLNYLLF